MCYLNDKIEPIFENYLITIPYVKPLVLKAKMVKNAPVFVFIREGNEYYIYVTYSYVWKDTLPKDLGEDLRDDIINAVDEYILRSRQHFLPALYSMSLKLVN